ncbi:ABC transporter substrate-binding protein [Rhodoligotrophos defluvii]|uniref:ABC transporter substrate-binding protein n=1 Tax=Rhodoligotrophos defluvii TaxID=2561934 RepID=UPI0010C93D99|nr:ABC transporter substrate-binding protein [Rhodoligotrophos defluvii]
MKLKAKMAVLLLACVSGPALADEAYKVGVSAALTGPASGNYAAAMEGLSLYINRLNGDGGLNGRKIDLILLDDQGEPSKAAANTKRLINQDQVVLLVNASLSSTFAPMIADSVRAGVPLLFASSVCPEEVFPPAEPTLFCTTGYAATYDSLASIDFIESQSGEEKVTLGLVAATIPISRAGIDFAEKLAGERGMKVTDKQIIPPASADYTSFATSLNRTRPDWVYTWAPWVTEVRTFESLRKLGWTGNYITWAHIEAEQELARLGDEGFYAIGTNALFSERLPVHEEISAAAAAAKATFPADQMAEGWIAGMAIEAAFEKAGWPVTGAGLAEAMANLSIDTKGLRAGPIQWSPENHFRLKQSYRVYRWDRQSGRVRIVRDWRGYDVE